MPAPFRLMVVDDHPLFIEALQLALRPVIAGVSVSSAATLAAAVERLKDAPVDLILLDLMLPDAGGVEGVARVREVCGAARVVVVSGRDDPVTVSLVKALGADSFISKALPLTLIQDRLRDIVAGRPVFPEAGASDAATAAAVSTLTAAQARVLAAAATGKLNKQIAYEMNLAEPTIKAHMSAIFKKLGVNNRTQAILKLEGRG